MEENFPPSRRCKPVFDDTNGIVQLVRTEPPEHCILKIEAFSALQDALIDSNKDHITSKEFKAGDYTWVLSVYPKGNEEEDGGSHLYLYVSLTDKLDGSTSVKASLRFFIYDQIRDNYLIFADVGDKRFNDLKTVWGIPKAISIESFTDASNGFLVNDSCIFGAEILLKNGRINRSIVSLLDSERERSYTWKIENFSDLKEDDLYSPVFSFGEWFWKLLVYPRGDREVKGKFLSLYLVLDNAKDLSHGSSLYTQFYLCIKTRKAHRANNSKTGSYWFLPESHGWGFQSFISISDLYNASKGFLVEDTLIIEVNIKVMLLLKDMDPTPKSEEYLSS